MSDKFPCPCCGHRTLAGEPPGTYESCPVCCWNDRPPEADSGISLAEAQSNFARCGASEPEYAEIARAPTEDEARPGEWRTVDARRKEASRRLVPQIEAAFEDVRRDGGVSLHQMDVLDDYGSAEELLEAEKNDPEARWQEIPAEKIHRFEASLVFLDARGYRFCVPAFLRACVRAIVEGEPPPISGLMFSLQGDAYWEDRYTLLDPPQKQAIAAFLDYVAEFEEGYDGDQARSALRRYWDEFLPEPA